MLSVPGLKINPWLVLTPGVLIEFDLDWDGHPSP